MKQTTRQTIFAEAAKKLRREFKELTATVGHSGLKGGEAEDLVCKFLQSHLPKRFDAGSGLIIDPNDNLSKQTDVIIYDALNCPVFRASEKAAIIPSDNVAAIVEVKSVLDKQKLRTTFENAKTVKSLKKTTDEELPAWLRRPKLTGTTNTDIKIAYLLFAFRTSLTLEKLTEHYHNYVTEYGVGRHIDVVFVLDKGLIMPMVRRAVQIVGLPEWDWVPLMLEHFVGEGAHIGVTMIPIKEDGLDLFLRLLLAHLMQFRAHLGDRRLWLKEQPQMSLTYLTSVTHETDPTRRTENLRRYADEGRSAVPSNSTRK